MSRLFVSDDTDEWQVKGTSQTRRIKMKVAYITFRREVIVEDVEDMSIEEIKKKAVEIHNDTELDDFYTTEDSIEEISIEEVEW